MITFGNVYTSTQNDVIFNFILCCQKIGESLEPCQGRKGGKVTSVDYENLGLHPWTLPKENPCMEFNIIC